MREAVAASLILLFLHGMFTGKKLSYLLAWSVIVLGIAFRIVIYCQNRNLIIDEANIARNVVERGFAGLTQPLRYEQYAPPVFLWITKLNTLLFGTSEYAFRLLPLLCSFIALVQLFFLLKKVAGVKTAWYPLFLMATGWIYIRYSTEVKQYSSDTVVAMSLLLLSINVAVERWAPWRFVLLWIVAGSMAIWASMPSVFILAGVGLFYAAKVWRLKNYKALILLGIIAAIWLLQFLLYYAYILKPEAHSDYLQNSHKNHFLYLLPVNAEQWNYNVNSLNTLLTAIGGKWALSIALHLICFFTGAWVLLRRKKAEAILFFVPILALLLAAARHDFSLLPRVSLFIMPLFLTVMGVGLEALFQIRFPAVKLVLVAACLVAMVNFNELASLAKPMRFERITESYPWIEQRRTDEKIYIHDLAMPQNIYYTTIHPDRRRWSFMKTATYFFWNTDMDSLCKTVQGKSFFVYGLLEDWDWKRSEETFPKYFNLLDSMTNETNRTFYFAPKQAVN